MNALYKMMALGSVAGALMAQGPRPRAITPPDPATAAQNQVTRLTAVLDLTTAQAAQATTIFTNSLTAINPLETTLNTDRQTLETAVTTNALSVIDQVASGMGTLTGQITSIQAKAEAAFYAILTTAQRTKVTQFGGLGGPGGFGGPGGRGRGPGGPPPGRP
jgi:hypothetical protein